ncbi:arsenate reductase family protein [bacterium]|nr:arsenate reductase family protein [bacterium]MBU1884178.1 arsenate reductase family protein [bacterium]
MKLVIFYEKPGCATNTKQKKSIRDAGYLVIERDLLNNEMSKETLYEFVKDKPVAEWFNVNAPKIKNKEIDPSNLNQEEALELILNEPILIKRPLMVIGDHKICGFDQEYIENFLNMKFKSEVSTECSSKLHFCATPA